MANKVTTSSVSDKERQYAKNLKPGQIVQSSGTGSYWLVTTTKRFVNLSTGFSNGTPDSFVVGDVLPFGTGLTLVVE